MNRDRIKKIARLLLAPTFTPGGLALRAVLIGVAFAALHAAGLREATSFISGTSATGQPLTTAMAMSGAVYLIVFFGAVIVSPILLLAAGILWGMERIVTRKNNP